MPFPLAPSQNIFDLALLALAAFVLPAISTVAGHRFGRAPDRSLIPRYLQTATRGWIVAALIAADWIWSGRAPTALGLALPPGLYGEIGLVIVAAATFAIAIQLLRLDKIVKPERIAKMQQQMREIKILPRTRAERNVFFLVAITAGIWEELLYRGFLFWFLAPYAGALGAAALSTVMFGLGHIYQGWRGALRATAVGLLFAVGYAVSGSLWWLIWAHALVDIFGGVVGWKVLGMCAPETQPA
ncbi:MAG TPA: CPBP family intramembrane glutamic endopeptidase [Rhizomicrobium sp.]|jgi:hypothetical protein|nr:CPBP family intramembrane glutamic endopeptidase [Rhizomicrobium sp.]